MSPGLLYTGFMHPKQINCDRWVWTKTACPGSAKPNPADTEWQEGVPPLQLPRNTSPPILDLPLSNRQPQHESLSEENIIIPFLPCWSSYHKLCWLMSVNFELVKTASVKYCLSKCDKLVIWWITYMELSILQTFEEAVFRTYKMKDLERSVWLRSSIHRRCFWSRCK